MKFCLLFSDYKDLRVLDLGCGVGRNSIYIAKAFEGETCTVDCIDILDVAIEILKKNSKEYNVEHRINGIVKPIEKFKIENGKVLEPNFEVNLKSDQIMTYLDEFFEGWAVIKKKSLIKSMKYLVMVKQANCRLT